MSNKIFVTQHISVDASEISEEFSRASGAGGQNVNKVETAVQLRFDARSSPNLPNDVSIRLQRLAGHRLTKDGVIVIAAQTYRTRERNREDALAKLLDLIRKAAAPPPPKRRATRPSASARKKRVDEKTKRGDIKRSRSRPDHD